MNNNHTELANRQTLAEIVGAWQQSEADIRQAIALLKQAEERLQTNLSPDAARRYYLGVFDRDKLERLRDPDEFMSILKRQAWRVLVDRMEIRRVMSVKRAEDLDKQLDSGEMPEITIEEILFMMDAAFSNIQGFLEEAVAEVFDILRPRGSHYKTNTEFDIGKRVILSWAVDSKWSGGGFQVNHYREKELRVLDNVFHHLDGAGLPKGYRTPLLLAIDATGRDGLGETEYFKFRCCKNRSLHIEFRRPELVTKLNQIAGGLRLYQGRQQAA